MPPHKRSRDDETSAHMQPAPDESVCTSLNADRDPVQRGLLVLARMQPSNIDGVLCEAEGEKRLYVITEVEHIARFFPPAVTRDRENNLLLNWEFLKLLPPCWYALVFPLQAEPGRFRAVPEGKLCLDGYPSPSGKATDADRAAGFSSRKTLRLALYPSAFRFFWAGLHEPLRLAGAWPAVPQVMMTGFALSEPVRRALEVRLSAIASPGSGPAWFDGFCSTIRRRHWPASSDVDQPDVQRLDLTRLAQAPDGATVQVVLTEAGLGNLNQATSCPVWLDQLVGAATRALVHAYNEVPPDFFLQAELPADVSGSIEIDLPSGFDCRDRCKNWLLADETSIVLDDQGFAIYSRLLELPQPNMEDRRDIRKATENRMGPPMHDESWLLRQKLPLNYCCQHCREDGYYGYYKSSMCRKCSDRPEFYEGFCAFNAKRRHPVGRMWQLAVPKSACELLEINKEWEYRPLGCPGPVANLLCHPLVYNTMRTETLISRLEP